MCSFDFNGHSKQFFSWKTCYSFSSQSSHVSPGVSGILSTLKLFLLDLSSRSIVSARRSPDQSDSHMSLQFGVRYLLIYFQHRSVSVKELQLYRPNLHKKGLSDLRQKKVNINLEFSTVQLVLVTNFSLNRQS